MLKALVLICWICILGSARGTDIPNEVTVASAEHSKTKNRDESQFSATHAADPDLITKSWTLPGSDGVAWLKLKLDQVHCVRQIVRYWKTGGVANTWTCTENTCTCEGNAESCEFLSIVISVEGEVPGYLPPSEECKYGDSVMIQRRGAGFSIHHLSVAEMIVPVPELSIVKLPESVSTVVGSTVTLVCEFNRPAETYGWRYRTTSNKQARVNEAAKLASGKWEQRDIGHLVISGVDKYDSGKYTCFGRAGTKNVFAPADVTVNYFETSKATGPESAQIVVGEAVTLSCGIPVSFPPAKVYMVRSRVGEDPELIENTAGYQVRHDDAHLELVIESATQEDAGDYYCTSVNEIMVEGSFPFQPHKSVSGELSVEAIQPSSFVVPNSHVIGDVGSSVVVEVSAVAVPAPTAQWVRSAQGGEFEPVNEESSSRMETKLRTNDYRYNYTLTVDNLSLADHETSFQLKLMNVAEFVSSPEITILVNHLICHTGKLQEITFDLELPVQLTCPMSESAYPEESVRWRYNNFSSSLKVSGNNLTTDSFKRSDLGEYFCETSNIAGTCMYTIILKTRTAPKEEEMVIEEEEEPTVDDDAAPDDMKSMPDEEMVSEEEEEPTVDDEAAPDDMKSMPDEEIEPEEEKEEENICPNTNNYKEMSEMCVREEWKELECADEDGATNIGKNSCGSLSKRCESEGKKKQCCKAIYCWGRKLFSEFPDLREGAISEEETAPKEEKASTVQEKSKNKRCQGSYKKMNRKCLVAEWTEMSCANQDGATDTGNNSCGTLSKKCEKNGVACCKAIFCWGRKLREDFPNNGEAMPKEEKVPEEEAPEEKQTKPKKKQCPGTYKKMNRKCLEEKWTERSCASVDQATNTGDNSCANLSKKCDKSAKNVTCCKAIFCWGRKHGDDFPDH